MKHSIIAWLCVAVLFLGGCSKDDVPIVTAKYQSALSYGVFEADQLAVLPWSSGRAESTMNHTMAETENGYYIVYSNYLYYADKADLMQWVLVCNKPNCDHYVNGGWCNAYNEENWVVLREDRLYFAEATGEFPIPVNSNGSGNIIVSTALDGTDKKFAYAIEDALMLSGGTAGGHLIGNQWFYEKGEIDAWGTIESRLFVLDAEGEWEIDVPDGAVPNVEQPFVVAFLRGDAYFGCKSISNQKYLKFQDDQLVGFDKKYVPETGGYISGTTLRIFKEDKGYFDIDVTTGKQVKVAENRLKDSTGMILAPNCVVESTLFSFNRKNRTEAGAIEVFNGESWRSVQLPEEWQNPGTDHWLHVLGITSDSIWIYGRNEEDFYGGWGYPSDLYRIPLDKEELVMEYCFTFPIPAK